MDGTTVRHGKVLVRATGNVVYVRVPWVVSWPALARTSCREISVWVGPSRPAVVIATWASCHATLAQASAVVNVHVWWAFSILPEANAGVLGHASWRVNEPLARQTPRTKCHT